MEGHFPAQAEAHQTALIRATPGVVFGFKERRRFTRRCHDFLISRWGVVPRTLRTQS
ncbi:hypothetical protein ABI_34090 [Asticcacaulis biprosthecium C19]|uniref:Uncharacterized protein n=1 Tax=Asticcacaulis biprosthecium C19 TaxID=715226 RepID=F4QQA1_9CAUL|nr:hypothetical protein ABI_34090 [Asticcacaulis biprosthecium C19]